MDWREHIDTARRGGGGILAQLCRLRLRQLRATLSPVNDGVALQRTLSAAAPPERASPPGRPRRLPPSSSMLASRFLPAARHLRRLRRTISSDYRGKLQHSSTGRVAAEASLQMKQMRCLRSACVLLSRVWALLGQ
eukprot:scaffold6976_cov118-Isochrysis_galbana.AAC.7